jgi:exodeoxyribonuclease VII large subunit
MQVLTVSQVTARLKELLESDLLFADLWISGEVSDLSQPPSGHTYFSLKTRSAAQGGLLRPNVQRQRLMLEHLQRGAQVIVHGRLSVYEQRGDLQVVVDFVQPEALASARPSSNALPATRGRGPV